MTMFAVALIVGQPNFWRDHGKRTIKKCIRQ
jgi:hypothetical protein